MLTEVNRDGEKLKMVFFTMVKYTGEKGKQSRVYISPCSQTIHLSKWGILYEAGNDKDILKQLHANLRTGYSAPINPHFANSNLYFK